MQVAIRFTSLYAMSNGKKWHGPPESRLNKKAASIEWLDLDLHDTGEGFSEAADGEAHTRLLGI